MNVTRQDVVSDTNVPNSPCNRAILKRPEEKNLIDSEPAKKILKPDKTGYNEYF